MRTWIFDPETETPLLAQHLFGLVDAERLAGRNVPRLATLEVESEVQTLDEQRRERDDHDDDRDDESDPSMAVEVDRGLAAVEPAGTGRCDVVGTGHDATSRPNALRPAMNLLRASRITAGRVKK